MLNTIPLIKKEFFAYRNGIVADTLRRMGDPHQFIMGCQLVDVMNIASRIEQSADIACELWSDRKHRECRMIAPMLYPTHLMNCETALEWALDVECNEIADVLCHRLLRNLTFAEQLAHQLAINDTQQVRYTAFRLFLNLLILGKIEDMAALKQAVEKERAAQPAHDIAQLLDSISEDL